MSDAIWAKYKIGEANNINDPLTGKPARPEHLRDRDGLRAPPFPNASIEKLRDAGVIFCACNVAMGVASSTLGGKIGVAKDVAMQGVDRRTAPGRHARAVGRARGGPGAGSRVPVLRHLIRNAATESRAGACDGACSRVVRS